MKAIRIHQYGGPEVLEYEDCLNPVLGPGEALVEIQAVGVNYIDIYNRTGLYPGSLPFTPGEEAAGLVSAVADGVTEVTVGDPVVYAPVRGSYAEQAVVPASRLLKLPPAIEATTAAALLLQGMTAHYLSHTTYPLRKGDKALIHAGAGGVGLLLIQMAKRIGAYVFTTVSTEEKAALAGEAGADKVILYTKEDFSAEVNKATDGQGVQVVYDSVGKTTFEKSLTCLSRRGYLVLFGSSSGPVPPVDSRVLAAKGSLFLTRPSLSDYTADRKELLWRADEVFNWVRTGELRVRIHKTFPLSEAASAHRELEGRLTVGKVLLIP